MLEYDVYYPEEHKKKPAENLAVQLVLNNVR